MAIYNLGNIMGEQPQQQQINPYAELMMKYMLEQKLGEQKSLRDEKLAKIQGEAEAKTYLAKNEIEKQQKNVENFKGTWQALSDMEEDKRNLFIQTPSGKEYLKTTKKYLPELFDENGGPIFFPSTKDQAKMELDNGINLVEKKLLDKGPDSLTEGERNVLQMKGYKDDIAEVTADLYKDPLFMLTMQQNPQKAQAIAKAALEQRINLRKGLQSSGGNPLSSTLTGQEEPVSNLAKPGSARFRVTPMK